MPKVSILVPVYKAEKTLDACVESILAQTFPDFELLLIDDESPDRCPEMCDAWAKRDPRIRVLHPTKTGPGPSGARNAGVQAAAAPWLTMVDSDDVNEYHKAEIKHFFEQYKALEPGKEVLPGDYWTGADAAEKEIIAARQRLADSEK